MRRCSPRTGASGEYCSSRIVGLRDTDYLVLECPLLLFLGARVPTELVVMPGDGQLVRQYQGKNCMIVYHLNCGVLHSPPNPPASCHCLLIENGGRLLLVESGIGLQDIANPLERIGQAAIAGAGFQFEERQTACRQIEKLGFRRTEVTDVVLTHCDPDHAGGLADFPDASVHVSNEEYTNLASGRERYSGSQFSHQPQWVTYPPATEHWFGLEARRLSIPGLTDIFLIPLFGHTLGHCGFALRTGRTWLLHVGDAYYLRAELTNDHHPVSALAKNRADDDSQRRASLASLRRISHEQASDVNMFGYHDFTEFPENSIGA